MATTTRRATPARRVKLKASMIVLMAACSTTSSAPPGTTPTTPALVGCEPEQPGCFTTSGDKAYAPPATSTCASPGGPGKGSPDMHCTNPTAMTQNVAAASCSVGGDAGAFVPPTGPCGENGSEYGATMNGTEGDDDDCKYHVTWASTSVCENDGVYFTVTANYLTGSKGPLTGACTFAELCWNTPNTPGGGTPAPTLDSRPPYGEQQVVEGPPGTYTIGPVEFNEPGAWTVRFHFNEICCDVVASSPHGHAAFLVEVP